MNGFLKIDKMKIRDIVIRIVCKCGSKHNNDEMDGASADLSQPKLCGRIQLPRIFVQFLEKHAQANESKRNKTISGKAESVCFTPEPQEKIQEEENIDSGHGVSVTK